MLSYLREVRLIELKATDILNSHKITEPPIPIGDIATKLGVTVIPYDLSEDVSGILVIENNNGTIGYNPNNSKVRQRFTIAHELGHFVLHKNSSNEVFIDKDFIVKYRSNKQYTQLEFRQEQQANSFAAALLMPSQMVIAEVKKGIYHDLNETECIERLAKTFDVSVPAMSFRSANIELFNL